jgi:HSP20 family protein
MAELPVRRERGEVLPARWDPFQELDEMRYRIDRLFGEFFGGTTFATDSVWSPPVDLEETDDAWVVEADLPGVKKEDVTVELRDHELVIHGEIKERERTGMLRRHTRRTGRFDYRLTLPSDIDDDKIDATLDDGVLSLKIAKSERAQPRRIEVKGRG